MIPITTSSSMRVNPPSREAAGGHGRRAVTGVERGEVLAERYSISESATGAGENSRNAECGMRNANANVRNAER